MHRNKCDILVHLTHCLNKHYNNAQYYEDDKYAFDDECNVLTSQYKTCMMIGMPVWIFGTYDYYQPKDIHTKYDRIL